MLATVNGGNLVSSITRVYENELRQELQCFFQNLLRHYSTIKQTESPDWLTCPNLRFYPIYSNLRYSPILIDLDQPPLSKRTPRVVISPADIGCLS